MLELEWVFPIFGNSNVSVLHKLMQVFYKFLFEGGI